MKKIYKNKRGGADTIIAALLLIGIAIAGSFIVYRTLFTSASNITNKPLIFVSDASLITFQNSALLQLTIQNQGSYIANLTKISIYSPSGNIIYNNATINQPILPGGQISLQQKISSTSGEKIISGTKYLIILTFSTGFNQSLTLSVNIVAQ
jgi:hypothetical protein